MQFDLENYEPVASRFGRFIDWATQQDSVFSVVSEMLSAPGADICVFKTTILMDGIIVSTGHAEEIRNAGHVNKSSHLENCETSSLGRCLAAFPMHNFAGTDFSKRPSREEMSKVQRTQQAQPFTPPADGQVRVKGPQHGELPQWLIDAATAENIYEVYDNRDRVGDSKRPWFKAVQFDKAFWPPRGNTALPIVPVTPDDVEEPF